MRKLLLLLLLPFYLQAQNIPISAFKSYPFPTQLTAAAKGSRIAWALDEQGRRNVYVAEGTDYKPRKLTHYPKDDGQEITSLSFSDDGKWLVFICGGEQSINWVHHVSTQPGFELEA